MARGIDSDELIKLTDTILQLRKDQNRAHEELRAQNDALHVLRVLRMRKKEDRAAASPFGYRTWWLTQESKSGFAMDRAFPAKKGIQSIMRPEFLLNYITYNPTTNEVKESLRTIYPSLLGIRLGSRLDQGTFTKVLKKILEVHKTDPARAQAIVVEHSEALMSQSLSEFTLTYTSPI
jgi:hypothetical protein